MTQTDFRAAIFNPALPVPQGLTGPQGSPAGRRFNVYRNNVTVSLTEALAQTFPVVRKLVGEAFFAAMAREYLRAHPPSSPLLMFYGDAMPAFLAAFPPVGHLGYLPDIARLELALRQSYHAADAAAVPAERLGALAPEDLLQTHLTLAPAVRLVCSPWPIHSIWLANTRGAPPPTATVAEDVLLLRPEFDPEPHLLPYGSAAFLAALMAGRSLGEAFGMAAPFDLAAVLGLLLSNGAVTGLETGERP